MSTISASNIRRLSALTDTSVFATEEPPGYARAIDLLTVVVGLVGIWGSVCIMVILGELTVALA
jgi:hypothetical protein